MWIAIGAVEITLYMNPNDFFFSVPIFLGEQLKV